MADTTLSHMPLAERGVYGNAVGKCESIDALMQQEFAVWMRLQPLDVPSLLESSDWAMLREAFGEAKVMDERIRGVVREVIETANLGLSPPAASRKDIPTDEEWGNAFCRPFLVSSPVRV